MHEAPNWLDASGVYLLESWQKALKTRDDLLEARKRKRRPVGQAAIVFLVWTVVNFVSLGGLRDAFFADEHSDVTNAVGMVLTFGPMLGFCITGLWFFKSWDDDMDWWRLDGGNAIARELYGSSKAYFEHVSLMLLGSDGHNEPVFSYYYPDSIAAALVVDPRAVLRVNSYGGLSLNDTALRINFIPAHDIDHVRQRILEIYQEYDERGTDVMSNVHDQIAVLQSDGTGEQSNG